MDKAANDKIKKYIDKTPYSRKLQECDVQGQEDELTNACTGMAPREYKELKGKTSGSARDLFDVKLKTLAL